MGFFDDVFKMAANAGVNALMKEGTEKLFEDTRARILELNEYIAIVVNTYNEQQLRRGGIWSDLNLLANKLQMIEDYISEQSCIPSSRRDNNHIKREIKREMQTVDNLYNRISRVAGVAQTETEEDEDFDDEVDDSVIDKPDTPNTLMAKEATVDTNAITAIPEAGQSLKNDSEGTGVIENKKEGAIKKFYELLQATLNKYGLDQFGYNIWFKDIPRKKLDNAKTVMGVQADEEVLILFDDTAFGSAKDGMLITTWGIRYNESLYSKWNISWEELKTYHAEDEKKAVVLKKLHADSEKKIIKFACAKPHPKMLAEFIKNAEKLFIPKASG
ncbi:MAG: hypothetical protein LBT33_03085 [Spirochaetia bacterium]|jgi:hypothetical protein|nr:hypothetical protein [Spirochaetia bacterium]